MKFQYRFPNRKLDVIARCSSCWNTKAFPAFSMHNYERLTCHKCSAKYPQLLLPYADEHVDDDQMFAYSYRIMKHFKTASIQKHLDDLLEGGAELGIEYVRPKPCIHCGVIDHGVDMCGMSNGGWAYVEQNSTEEELYAETRFDDQFTLALDSKADITFGNGAKLTCIPCTAKIRSENRELSEEEGC
jgi:hypothetical protein